MISLKLTAHDAEMLANVLEYYISELRMEVADTDRKDFRDKLKAQEKDLRRMVDTLRRSLAQAPDKPVGS